MPTTRFAPWLAGATVLCALPGFGCAPGPHPQAEWWENLQGLCGQAFEGRLSRYDERTDAGWIGRAMVMHVRECDAREIRIPLHVGEDRSRTWVLTRLERGIRLQHSHRHEDGSDDVLTGYGGRTKGAGSARRQEFPADDFSRALFQREGISDSMHNIWYMEIVPGTRFSYGLTRFNRDFRADFDLSRPVEAPPPPWGAEPARRTAP